MYPVPHPAIGALEDSIILSRNPATEREVKPVSAFAASEVKTHTGFSLLLSSLGANPGAYIYSKNRANFQVILYPYKNISK